jgi:hypothetical protein
LFWIILMYYIKNNFLKKYYFNIFLKIILLQFQTLLESWTFLLESRPNSNKRVALFFFLNYAPSKTVWLSNCYADNGKLDMSLKLKKGYSWIEFRNKIHVWDWRCIPPESENIYIYIYTRSCNSWWKKVETEARRPASDVSLHDEDEERECIQIGHSEMLALSFALISTQPGAAIRFSKILRVLRMSWFYEVYF